MKKFITIALVLVLTMSLFAGCRSGQNENTGNTGSGMTNSGGSNMLPDTQDTIDPTNGANQDSGSNGAGQNSGSNGEGQNSDNGNGGTNSGTGADQNSQGNSGNGSDSSRNRSRIFPGH